jgi:hypothetical protein
MCKAAAKKGSKFHKSPPCEWVHCEPAVLEEAVRVSEVNTENYGDYYCHPQLWPFKRYAFNEKVMARTYIQSEKEEKWRPATIIGGFRREKVHLHAALHATQL